MKKVLFTLAIAGMFGFVACNNTKPVEEPVAEEQPVEVVATEEENTEEAATIEEVATEIAEQVVENVVNE